MGKSRMIVKYGLLGVVTLPYFGVLKQALIDKKLDRTATPRQVVIAGTALLAVTWTAALL